MQYSSSNPVEKLLAANQKHTLTDRQQISTLTILSHIIRRRHHTLLGLLFQPIPIPTAIEVTEDCHALATAKPIQNNPKHACFGLFWIGLAVANA